MIQFFGKLLLFTLILVSVKWLLVEITSPINSSPDALAQKIRLLNAQKAQTNTLFIGSSRTYTGLIPSYFDSLTKQTHSLNLGVSSLYMPYTADLCRQVLSRQELRARYILFELSLPAGSADPFQGNPLADAGFYWQYWATPRADSTTHAPKAVTSHLNEYVYNLLSPLGPLAILRMQLAFLVEKVVGKARHLASAQPQPVTEKRLFTNKQTAAVYRFESYSNGYITSNRRLSLPSPALSVMYQRGLRVYQSDSLRTNPAYVFYKEKLNTLHQLAARRGVRVLFFLPSRLTAEEAAVLIPIFHQLSPKQRLVVPHDARFNQLFDPRFSMDESHLNDDGARIYTTLIAEAFRRQIH